MNCETCQELIHDLIDGSITQRDELTLNTHLKECLDCDSVRQDLASIVLDQSGDDELAGTFSGHGRAKSLPSTAPRRKPARWAPKATVGAVRLDSRALISCQRNQTPSATKAGTTTTWITTTRKLETLRSRSPSRRLMRGLLAFKLFSLQKKGKVTVKGRA